MIRVLHFMPSYGGGIGSFIVNIVRSLDTPDIVNDIVSFTDYPDFYKAEFQKKGGKALTIKQIRLKIIIKNIKEIRRVIKTGKYDVVFLHITDVGALWFSTWARSCGVHRIIIHSHQTNHNKNKDWIHGLKFKMYRYLTVAVADQLSSCSKMASVFRFGSKQVMQHKVMHIPNSINVDAYKDEISDNKKNSIRSELDVQPSDIFIGHIGRFDPQKNHVFMLKIIRRMKERGLFFKWVFIGAGLEFDKIYSLANDWELMDRIVFAGRRNDVPDIFKTLDLSILPSHYEGLPTVAIECQAAGTPMLLADTITPECDMGLGLLKFLSLKDEIDVWVDAIIKMAKMQHVSASLRIKNITDRKFVSKEASKLFASFIRGEILTYNFEDYKIPMI